MLSKIFKYESKSMSRVLLPLYLALLGSTLITGILIRVNDIRLYAEDNAAYYFSTAGRLLSLLQTLFVVAFALLIAGLGIATIIMIINRFNKGCLGDEGYLTFTLPVGIDAQLWGRLLTAALWIFLSVAAGVLSIVLLVGLSRGDFGFLQEMFQDLRDVLAQEGVARILAKGSIWCVLELFAIPLLVYCCLSLGQLIMPKHRIVGAFVVYFAQNLISQCITIFLGVFSSRDEYVLDYLIDENAGIIDSFFTFALISSLLWICVYYFVTRYVLSKKLNLE